MFPTVLDLKDPGEFFYWCLLLRFMMGAVKSQLSSTEEDLVCISTPDRGSRARLAGRRRCLCGA